MCKGTSFKTFFTDATAAMITRLVQRDERVTAGKNVKETKTRSVEEPNLYPYIKHVSHGPIYKFEDYH